MDAELNPLKENSLTIKTIIYKDENSFLSGNLFVHDVLLIFNRKIIQNRYLFSFSRNILMYFVTKCLHYSHNRSKTFISSQKFEVINLMNLNNINEYFINLGVNNASKFILNSWGSDLKFQSLKNERKKIISKALSSATHFAAETDEEYVIAKKIGFQGENLFKYPNSGHRIIDGLQLDQTSKRKMICVKGYANHMGEVSRVLDSFIETHELIKKFKIKIFSVDSSSTIDKIEYMKVKYKLDIDYFMNHQLTNDEVLNIFRNSRIYISNSRCDGIGTSLLDAMQFGAFPIVSSTGAAEEWITHSSTGFIVDYDSNSNQKTFLETALLDNNLVDSGAEINLETIKSYFTRERYFDTVKNYYG